MRTNTIFSKDPRPTPQKLILSIVSIARSNIRFHILKFCIKFGENNVHNNIGVILYSPSHINHQLATNEMAMGEGTTLCRTGGFQFHWKTEVTRPDLTSSFGHLFFVWPLEWRKLLSAPRTLPHRVEIRWGIIQFLHIQISVPCFARIN